MVIATLEPLFQLPKIPKSYSKTLASFLHFFTDITRPPIDFRRITSTSACVLRKETVKGQLLGTSTVNLADYGVIENAVTINALVNLKKGYSSKSVQSALILSLEHDEKDSPSSLSPSAALSKEPSLDNDSDRFEIASFTDDDSSEAATSSPSQVEKNIHGNAAFEPQLSRDALPPSTDASSGKGSSINDNNYVTGIYDRSMTFVELTSKTPVIRSSLSSLSSQVITGEARLGHGSDSSKSDSKLNVKLSKDPSHPTKEKVTMTTREALPPLSKGQLDVNSVKHDSLEGYGSPSEAYPGKKAYHSDISDDCSQEIDGGGNIERKDSNAELSHCKRELVTRIEMLEEELREAAATEVGLFSVVAEHASSSSKVHAPARRLARFYSNALRAGYQAKRTSAARALLSGLVVVSKSCGNDVPSHIAVKFSHSSGPQRKTEDPRPELSEMTPDEGEGSRLNEEISSFIIALETVESWLFSRIVESLWWQVMEQLVDRLDVAMFNAILCESADEMPTDPLSNPICDLKVLPIPAGKSSFGAGVELKNAIGSWSGWLTDFFDLDDDPTEHIDVPRDGKGQKSFKAFRLLHALSDLMMPPFGMLADTPTRKEVCPMFGPTIIRRVLTSFVADEFRPDPVPQNIIEALDTEEVSDTSDEILTSLPCTASPTKYSPPPAALLTCVGEVGRQVLQSSLITITQEILH